MDKFQAIQLMIKGQKITHKSFTSEEWMTIDIEDGMILLDDGVKCSNKDFWRDRMNEFWEEGYSLFAPLVPGPNN